MHPRHQSGSRVPTDRSRPARRGSRIPMIAGMVLFLGALGILAFIVTTWLLGAGNAPKTPPGQPVTVEIAKGSGTKRIAEKLKGSGVIDTVQTFRARARERGVDGSLRAGTYELVTGMSDDEALDALVVGPASDAVRVTIPEGWRIEQMAARYEEKVGIPADEFIALAKGGAGQFSAKHPYLADAHDGKLEGFLFPKTYSVRKDATATQVIEMMLDQFDHEIAGIDMAAAQGKGRSIAEVVTIASIIEREIKLPEERELGSSVIDNRLRIGMPLQMCSTVVYVLNRSEMRLTTAETKTESPYNTYLHKGLPPGPIASPGLASLNAAANPAETKYVYYVLTSKDGSHTFAETNAEFLAAKQKSKKVLGE